MAEVRVKKKSFFAYIAMTFSFMGSCASYKFIICDSIRYFGHNGSLGTVAVFVCLKFGQRFRKKC